MQEVWGSKEDVAATKELTRTGGGGGVLREAVSYALGLSTAPDFHTPGASPRRALKSKRPVKRWGHPVEPMTHGKRVLGQLPYFRILTHIQRPQILSTNGLDGCREAGRGETKNE